ncbi:MAG: diphosphomevalonate decarboxylase [Watsoniomyces obsoletus]|nr:MAG: diphosphomevalonate decarboxylase [Watsoniomyces obsoletus]
MTSPEIYRASVTAPVNIAVIKYWGKRDVALNLPTNSSLSVTLSQADLRTHTTASCSSSFSAPDTLILNSLPQDISSPRVQACITSLRSLRAEIEDGDPSLPKLSTYPLRINSQNNFPTAAGLASSAAGFAAFVRSIANLFELPHSATHLSRIARQGSGSACRSMFGGYVSWQMGHKEDGSDSIAVEIAPVKHWENMRALILVVSNEKKSISSTAGMQATVATSTLFKSRTEQTVPQRMKMMEKAILDKNFQWFAKITMKDSNSFHATCLDTDPPIFYLNDVSRAAIRIVEKINENAREVVAAYTFDAGPNAVIYYLEENKERVVGVFKEVLGDGLKKGHSKWDAVEPRGLEALDEKTRKILREGVADVILTGVGEGPVSVDEHLIDDQGDSI